MKKITLSFVVTEEVANEIQNELLWGNYANAAEYLQGNCETCGYNFINMEG